MRINRKSFTLSKRSKAILVIGVLAIGIGAISKKFTSYSTEGCTKGKHELTFNTEYQKRL